MGDLHPAREVESLEVLYEGKRIIQCDDRLPVSVGDAEWSGWKEGDVLNEAVLCERCSSSLEGLGYFFEVKDFKDDMPRSRAEYLVGEDVLVTTNWQVHHTRPEHAIDQVNALMDRREAESLICIETAPGREPQGSVT